MRIERELMRGAGPVAVLKLLEAGEMYGYELVEALDRQSGGDGRHEGSGQQDDESHAILRVGRRLIKRQARARGQAC